MWRPFLRLFEVWKFEKKNVLLIRSMIITQLFNLLKNISHSKKKQNLCVKALNLVLFHIWMGVRMIFDSLDNKKTH